MKRKKIAGIFALFFGFVGLHRFYLGQKAFGVLYMFMFGVTMVMTAEEGIPFILITLFLGIIDALLLLAMPQIEFDERYNSKYLHPDDLPAKQVRKRKSVGFGRKTKMDPYKATGITLFQEYDYEAAIDSFKKSLNIKYDDLATHFNLACCYASLEETDPAFFHLSKAVEFGFVDFEKIYCYDALAFLRTQPQFGDFVRHGYQLPTPSLPAPQTDLLSTSPPRINLEEKKSTPDLLEQILRLGDLRDQGILTEEEFTLQKKKLLESPNSNSSMV